MELFDIPDSPLEGYGDVYILGAGSRSIENPIVVRKFFNAAYSAILDTMPNIDEDRIHFIHGGAKGVDTLSASWAKDVGIKKVVSFEPDWYYPNGNFDPKAGFKRNTDLVSMATHAILIRDHYSVTNGVGDTLKKVIKKGIPFFYHTMMTPPSMRNREPYE